MEHKLAIVIPAYKATFFSAALESLAAQQNKDFTVYIGDDNSPEDLKAIVDRFIDRLTIRYTRFGQNIGAKNLVHQWTRSAALSKNEEWIWLFSDDDIAHPACVSSFYEALQTNKDRFDVYRFNTVVIDKNGKKITVPPQGPDFESSEQMAYNILLGKRGNSMPDHIFSRKIYERKGGFVFTDYAQAADWATSILFASEKGMCIIPEAKLYWRMSDKNISAVSSQMRTGMLKGHLQFISWLHSYFQYLQKRSTGISYQDMHSAAQENLVSVIVSHYKGLTPSTALIVFWYLRKQLDLPFGQSIKIMVLILKRASPALSKISFRIRKVIDGQRKMADS